MVVIDFAGDRRQVGQYLLEQTKRRIDLRSLQFDLAKHVIGKPVDELTGLDLGPGFVVVSYLACSSCHGLAHKDYKLPSRSNPLGGNRPICFLKVSIALGRIAA